MSYQGNRFRIRLDEVKNSLNAQNLYAIKRLEVVDNGHDKRERAKLKLVRSLLSHVDVQTRHAQVRNGRLEPLTILTKKRFHATIGATAASQEGQQSHQQRHRHLVYRLGSSFRSIHRPYSAEQRLENFAVQSNHESKGSH